MEHPKEQLEELKRYCTKLKSVPEGGVTFLYLEELRLPTGCTPDVCDALLCPVPRDGYPSRLFLSVQVSSPYTRNWNVTNARIAESNWFAFSWNVDLVNPTLAQLLVAHLNGFAKQKMRLHIKLMGALYDRIKQDLVRPHPFAAERVGFVFGRMGSLEDGGKLILLTRYHTIPDAHYVDDPTVGARIGPDAMTWAMQEVYRGRPVREGIFHIHLHGHGGETGMSGTDAREIPAMIPGFRSVGRDAAHGVIILSRNHGSGWVWLPGDTRLLEAGQISVIGAPVGVFERRLTR